MYSAALEPLLSKEWEEVIPPIQSLVVNKSSGQPGKGFFQTFVTQRTLTRLEKQRLLDNHYNDIFSYRWDRVLRSLGLQVSNSSAATTAVELARNIQGVGESAAHKALKEMVYSTPSLVGCNAGAVKRAIEYRLPSGDRIDVFFEYALEQVAVEVKPRTSPAPDIARGLFQCLKYELILNKWLLWKNETPNVRVVLALEGEFPTSLIGLRNALSVEVIDRLGAYS